MKYISTRGGDRVYTFEQAILSGWADNGGMLLPEHIPVVDQATLASWRYEMRCFLFQQKSTRGSKATAATESKRLHGLGMIMAWE